MRQVTQVLWGLMFGLCAPYALIMCVGCGGQGERACQVGAAAPYIAEFERACGVSAGEVNVVWGSTGHIGTGVVGFCEWSTETTPYTNRVTLDPEYWATASDTGRRLLVYHELGHCVLHKDHDDRRLAIMNTNLPRDNQYSEALVHELCSH